MRVTDIDPILTRLEKAAAEYDKRGNAHDRELTRAFIRMLTGVPGGTDYGDIIYARRKEKKMSQNALAIKCGLSHGIITRAERLPWSIKFGMMLKIFEALGHRVEIRRAGD
jgi:ribosome-binding protein aMBF1 (putative translation factor)